MINDRCKIKNGMNNTWNQIEKKGDTIVGLHSLMQFHRIFPSNRQEKKW